VADELSSVFEKSGDSSEVATETATEVSTEVENKADVEKTTEAKTETDVETKAEQTKTEEVEDSETASEQQDNRTPEHRAAVKQAKDERQKRQEAQAQLREAQEKLAKYEKEPVKRPDVFEDQEAFADSIEAQQDAKIRQATLNIERKMMMRMHDDYESVEASVLEEMSKNPALKSYLQQSENVAEAVYEYGKQRKEFDSILGFKKDETLAKLRAEIKAELEKEYKGRRSNSDDDDLSPSLADARGASSANEKGIETLDDVFK